MPGRASETYLNPADAAASCGSTFGGKSATDSNKAFPFPLQRMNLSEGREFQSKPRHLGIPHWRKMRIRAHRPRGPFIFASTCSGSSRAKAPGRRPGCTACFQSSQSWQIAIRSARCSPASFPPKRPEDMPGTWQRYYTRWEQAAREQLDPALLKLLPPLAKLCPPATVVDKTRYSGFAEPHLLSHLQSRATDGLIVTGSETDVCVLSTARMTVRGAPWPVSELSVTVECQSAIVLAGKGKAPACLGGICRGLNSGTAQSHD